MRFGWLVAAAAMVCAGSAGADTVTQTFFARLQPHGSSAAPVIGALNLSPDQQILSAMIGFTVETDYAQHFQTDVIPTEPSLGSFSYSGSSGFDLSGITPLPAPISLSVPFSGTVACVNDCDVDKSFAGALAIPSADLSLFAGSAFLTIEPTGGVIGTITSDQGILYTLPGDAIETVAGTITYVVSGPSVPEPSTWALFIVGLGLSGTVLREQLRIGARKHHVAA